MNSYDYIKENIENILKRIHVLNSKVRLVAVSKTFDVKAVETAYFYGLREFGESRIQEAETKVSVLKDKLTGIKWHMIGHLQTNKAKKAAALFDMIQSVDSFRVAEKISRAFAPGVKEILLEIKVSDEKNKSGINPDAIAEEAYAISALPNVRIKGLMTIAPYFENQDEARPFFRKARVVFESLKKAGAEGIDMEILSMGMSGDFEAAIDEGANMVRVGTGIFGKRQ